MNLILRTQFTIFFHQIIAFALKPLDFVDISQIYQRDLLKIFEFIIQSIKMITDAFKVSLFFSYFFIFYLNLLTSSFEFLLLLKVRLNFIEKVQNFLVYFLRFNKSPQLIKTKSQIKLILEIILLEYIL
jgi:hypothetical protein